VNKTERDFLTPEESWRLLEFARNDFLGPAIWIAILAGLRPSEIQALVWESVDFCNCQILIRAAYNRKVKRIQPFPKQRDWGIAPMPPALMEFLKKKSRGKALNDFVSQAQSGGMLDYGTYYKRLLILCRESGIKQVSPHELRHSCTELYIQAGASAEDIRRLLNQKSLSATARYIHRTDERLLSIASMVRDIKSDRSTSKKLYLIR
jgi:integrase